MNKYVVMGAQGSGKSTQAAQLARAYDFVHINVGDIFRWNIQNHTKLGALVQRTVASGRLVSDDIVEQVVHGRLERHDWKFGFVLDGFPRNLSQAEFFLENYDIDRVVHVDIPDAVVLMRIASRRHCSRCGLDYNLILRPPAEPHVCDSCHGPITSRPEDTPDIVRVRLRDYHTATEPILELFRSRGLVETVDGVCAPAEVQRAMRSVLGLPEPQANPAKALTRPDGQCQTAS